MTEIWILWWCIVGYAILLIMKLYLPIVTCTLKRRLIRLKQKYKIDRWTILEKYSHDPDEDMIMRAMKRNGHTCPDCNGILLQGPEGSGSINVKCSVCGSEFNLSYYGRKLMFAERINRGDTHER